MHMNALIENNYIKEMKYGANFAYVLSDNSAFCLQSIKFSRVRPTVVLLSV